MDYKYFRFILLAGTSLFNDLKKKEDFNKQQLFAVAYSVDIVELSDKKGHLAGE